MYKYNKEAGIYIYYDIDDNEKFSSNTIALIINQGQIIKHGPGPQMIAEAQKMVESGQQVSCAESADWDLNDLNKKTKHIIL